MGKSSKPLTILCTSPELLPYLQGLIEKGHTVDVVDGPPYDRVVGPNCFKLTPEMLDNLPKNTLETLIKGARLEKYGEPGAKPIVDPPSPAGGEQPAKRKRASNKPKATLRPTAPTDAQGASPGLYDRPEAWAEQLAGAADAVGGPDSSPRKTSDSLPVGGSEVPS